MCELLRDNLYEFSRYNREARCEPTNAHSTLPRTYSRTLLPWLG